MKAKDTEELKTMVQNLIQNASKEKPIKGKKICQIVNLKFREVKKIITELRNDYPIVSKETNEGGYWIAKDSEDILAFIRMITARKNGYENTISKMKNHIIVDEFLDGIDGNHIPYID